MADQFDIATGDVRVRIEGLNTVLRNLKKAGADSRDMSELMHSIGGIVVEAARPRTPLGSGRLAGSIRAGRGKTKAVVRAGGARIPYAGVIHYGWPQHNIEPHPFLTDALSSERADVLRALENGLDEIFRKNGLK